MKVRPLTNIDTAQIASWRYPGRYSTYDFDNPSTLAHDHFGVSEDDELVGYCCFGAPARVGGADPEHGTLDVGYGLAPNRMARGLGRRFVATVLEFARQNHAPERFRMYILEWNTRSRTVAARLGFAQHSAVRAGRDVFVVVVRDEPPTARGKLELPGR
jgi:[ribosomal protein S18]-alanine N-acetyltransferase